MQLVDFSNYHFAVGGFTFRGVGLLVIFLDKPNIMLNLTLEFKIRDSLAYWITLIHYFHSEIPFIENPKKNNK